MSDDTTPDPVAVNLAHAFADVLRGISAREDKAFYQTFQKTLFDMEDRVKLSDQMGCLKLLYGEGVSQAFISYMIRWKPTEEHPKGEIDQEQVVALLLINEVIFLNTPWWKDDWPEEAKNATVMFVNCNDVFAWGCADAETIELHEIESLFDLWEKDSVYGAEIWCILKRKELPQRPVYNRIKERGIWDLDALAEEHGLKANHYDGIMTTTSTQKYNAYVFWEKYHGREPRPFTVEWWKGWDEFTAAVPDWNNEGWKAAEKRLLNEWRAANGYMAVA